MLSNGETDGVFQLESSGMKPLVKDLKPSVFEDLGALVALFVPDLLIREWLRILLRENMEEQGLNITTLTRAYIERYIRNYCLSGTNNADCTSFGRIYAWTGRYFKKSNG